MFMNEIHCKEKIKRLQEMSTLENKNTVELIVPLHTYYTNMMQKVKKLLEESYELNKSELDLLVTLTSAKQSNGTLAPTELYDHLVFSSGGMTKLLKKLETKEYITRVDNPEDKRSKLVQITTCGKEIALKAMNDVLSLETKCFSCLDDNEKNTLSQTFSKLVAS